MLPGGTSCAGSDLVRTNHVFQRPEKEIRCVWTVHNFASAKASDNPGAIGGGFTRKPAQEREFSAIHEKIVVVFAGLAPRFWENPG